MRHTSPSSTKKIIIYNQLLTYIGRVYICTFFSRSSPFLPPRSPVSSFGSMQTQHARQTKVCKGKQVLLSLGTLLPAVLAPSSCHGPWSCCKLARASREQTYADRCMDDAVCYMPWCLVLSNPNQLRLAYPTWTSAYGHVCRPIITLAVLLLVCFTPPYVHCIGRRICMQG